MAVVTQPHPHPFSEIKDWSNVPLFSVNPDTLPSIDIPKSQKSKHPYYVLDPFWLEQLDTRLVSVVLATTKTPTEIAKEMGRIILSTQPSHGFTCAICLNEISGWTKHTPCGHVFHSKCLTTWTNETRKRSCPSCRADVFPNDMSRNRGNEMSDDDQIEEYMQQWMADLREEDEEQQPPSDDEEEPTDNEEPINVVLESNLSDDSTGHDSVSLIHGTVVNIHVGTQEEDTFLWELQQELDAIESSSDAGSAGFRSDSPDSLG
jgi:hypothetical protein